MFWWTWWNVLWNRSGGHSLRFILFSYGCGWSQREQTTPIRNGMGNNHRINVIAQKISRFSLMCLIDLARRLSNVRWACARYRLRFLHLADRSSTWCAFPRCFSAQVVKSGRLSYSGLPVDSNRLTVMSVVRRTYRSPLSQPVQVAVQMRSEDVQVKRINVALKSVTDLLDPEIQSTDTT